MIHDNLTEEVVQDVTNNMNPYLGSQELRALLRSLNSLSGMISGQNSEVTTLASPTVLDLSHAQKFLLLNATSPITLTIPPQSSVEWHDGCQIEGVQLGEGGSVSFVAGAGVTLEWDKRWALKTAAPGAVFGLKRLAADRWLVFGALEAA